MSEALVLMQRRIELTYKDIEGEVYHYPRIYFGRITEGLPFVYYQPGERAPDGSNAGRVYFGTGVIGEVTPDPEDPTHRYAELLDYREFPRLVPLRDADGIGMEEWAGQSVVYQSAVRRIDGPTLTGIVHAAGEVDSPAQTSQPSGSNPLDIISTFDQALSDATPQQRREYVRKVERPSALSKAIKEVEGDRCQICGTEGFTQRTGKKYSEAHHLVEVSKLELGTLASSYVIVLCPTCHRKMHFADMQLEQIHDGWRITIDGAPVQVKTKRTD